MEKDIEKIVDTVIEKESPNLARAIGVAGRGKPSPQEFQELLEKIKSLPRYTPFVCNCSLGPHVDYEQDSDGNWMRFDQIESLIKDELERQGR